MKTIIVPTDFSATANNAADYAVHFAQQVNANRIILLHAYEIPVAIDPMMPGIQIPEIEGFKNAAEERLYQFRAGLLLKYANTNMVFDIVAVYGSILSALEDLANNAPIEMVVMGITGGGALEETLIGSNTVHIAENSHIPLLIVPANAPFKPIQKLMFVGDSNSAETYLPVDQIAQIQALTNASLQKFDASAHSDHFMEAVNQFIDEQAIDLVISVPKEHSFFAKLFAKSHTKQLAFHSHVPLLVLHKNS